MKEHLTRLLHFNVWSNETLLNALDREHPAWFTPIESSFKGIQATWLHIWDAENIWFKRLMGESIQDFPSKGFAGSVEDLVDGLIQQSKEWYFHVEESPVSIHTKIVKYKNLSGLEYESSYKDIITHVTNHSSYHRGQIVTMLRQAGINEIPSTDFIHYLRQISKRKAEIKD